MSYSVLDSAGIPRDFASDVAGSTHTPHSKVVALPGTVESDTSQSRGFLSTLAGIVTSGRAAVDLSSTVNGYLQTLANAISSNRMAVDLTSTVTTYLSNLVTIAGAITAARMAVNVDSTTQGKIDAISAAQAPPSALYGGKKTIASAGSNAAINASQALTEGVWVRALDANTGLVYVGNSSVTSGGNGTRLAARETVFIRCNNLALVYVDTAVNGEGVTFLGW